MCLPDVVTSDGVHETAFIGTGVTASVASLGFEAHIVRKVQFDCHGPLTFRGVGGNCVRVRLVPTPSVLV